MFEEKRIIVAGSRARATRRTRRGGGRNAPTSMETGSMEYECPHCSARMSVEEEQGARELQCLACGGLVIIPGEGGDAAEAAHDARRDELDGYRIRQVSMLRRAKIRGRSYVLIGALLCLFGGGQCFWVAIAGRAAMGPAWVGVYIIAGTASAAISVRLFLRARRMSRELRRSALGEPQGEADFSTLSDGSQYWRNLEDVREE
jgi:DNA-directed RNA polymerase subunit RPC12/RpoP